MKKSKVLIFFSFVLVFACLISITSCKDPDNPKAIVTVFNGEDQSSPPVEGAIVRVYSDPSITDPSHLGSLGYVDPDSLKLEDIQTSDELGQTHHEFKYESILHVEAKFAIKKNDTLYGYGALILKDEETYVETIILKRQPAQN